MTSQRALLGGFLATGKLRLSCRATQDKSRSRRIVRSDPARLPLSQSLRARVCNFVAVCVLTRPDGSGWTMGLQMVHSSASVNAVRCSVLSGHQTNKPSISCVHEVLASGTVHDLVTADDATKTISFGCPCLAMSFQPCWDSGIQWRHAHAAGIPWRVVA